jgi:hypothetical protein
MPSLSASLPLPDPDALAHSAKLTQHLVDRIHALGGWLSFADFMEALLYAPGLGYYAAGAAKFCEEGDFVTAPEISPLFGRTLARFAPPVLTSIQGAISISTFRLFGVSTPILGSHSPKPKNTKASFTENYTSVLLDYNLTKRTDVYFGGMQVNTNQPSYSGLNVIALGMRHKF